MDAATTQAVICGGDTRRLTPEQRVQYYISRCESAGLDPRTQPFAFIIVQGKEVLYALRAATDQLAARHGIVVEVVSQATEAGIRTVTVRARAKDGRQTDEIGCVNVAGLTGDALCNAYMKAMTKAKRRAIISICGLGLTDESEVETIPGAIPSAPPVVAGLPAAPDRPAPAAPAVAVGHTPVSPQEAPAPEQPATQPNNATPGAVSNPPAPGTWGTCPKCGAALRRRNGARGPFFGCSTYPACRYTAPVPAEPGPGPEPTPEAPPPAEPVPYKQLDPYAVAITDEPNPLLGIPPTDAKTYLDALRSNKYRVALHGASKSENANVALAARRLLNLWWEEVAKAIWTEQHSKSALDGTGDPVPGFVEWFAGQFGDSPAAVLAGKDADKVKRAIKAVAQAAKVWPTPQEEGGTP